MSLIPLSLYRSAGLRLKRFIFDLKVSFRLVSSVVGIVDLPGLILINPTIMATGDIWLYVSYAICAVTLWVAGNVLLRLYFSPISKFPGPRLAAVTFWCEDCSVKPILLLTKAGTSSTTMLSLVANTLSIFKSCTSSMDL